MPPEQGTHLIGATVTEIIQHQLCPITFLRPAQLRLFLPEQLLLLACLAHRLTITEKPQLFRTEWNLFFQDLPSVQPGHRRTEATWCFPARGLYPHSAPSAWSWWSNTTVRTSKSIKHGEQWCPVTKRRCSWVSCCGHSERSQELFKQQISRARLLPWAGLWWEDPVRRGRWGQQQAGRIKPRHRFRHKLLLIRQWRRGRRRCKFENYTCFLFSLSA